MEVKQVKLVYFSPTGTTRKVLESIAEGFAVNDVGHIDLTLPEGAEKTIPPFSDELVIIGAPVYGGRLPVEAIKRLKQMKAEKTLAVPVVLYGNREFEDALLELKNLSIELGFVPVAGGAFIGEHSFATKERPIATGRPDGRDVQKALDFGAKIKAGVASLKSPEAQPDVQIPGRFPYESGAMKLVVSPVTDEDACTVCGDCAEVCPTAAITVEDVVTTEVELCIRCSACIKVCPAEARYWENEKMKSIAEWLYENCADRKEPQVFGVDG